MTSEERDDNYWMGVRDALRMVDSFLRWARKHPKDAKSIDDFLAEGLIAAAKRCESCLGKELGMRYGSDDPEVDEPREVKEPPHFEEPIPDVEPEIEPIPDAMAELYDTEAADATPDDSTESDAPEEIKDEPEVPPVEPVSIDEIQTPNIEEEAVSSDDITFEGIKRDFLSDFPLSASELESEESDDTGPMPSTPEEVMRAVLEEEAIESAKIADEGLASPEEESVVESYDDVLEILESPPMSVDEPSPPVATPKRDLWSPYDEPPLPEGEVEEEESTSEDVDEESSSEESDKEPTTVKPPPPPPPPETDETEEERRRRARRLFFGT
jgi:hypothetical protein